MTLKASNYPTIRPSLDLNFAQTKRLDPRITFSRASTGTYFDANGVLQSAPAGVARFDHNPVSGESLGLLMEEARTNLLTYSEQFNQSPWTLGTFSLASNSTIAPNGILAGSTLTTANPLAADNLRYIINCTPGLTYAASIFIKGVPGTYIRFQIIRNTGSAGNNVEQDIQLTSEWTRHELSFTALSDVTSLRFEITRAAAGLTFATSIDIWGAQLEANGSLTSYIPTTTSAVTRAADVCTVTNSNIYDTDSFTIINQPFGASGGGSTLNLFDGPQPIKRATVYTTDLGQATINTAAGKTDEFWRWRVLGSSFALPQFFSDGQVTVDWGDGTIETLTTFEHTFSNGGGYHDIGFRLDSGTYFRPYINNNASHDTKVVALGPAPESMKLNGERAFYDCSNLEAFDATVDATGGTNFTNAWQSCSSLTSFPLINTAAVTNFQSAWQSCNSLTSFPAIDTSAATNLSLAWNGCSNIRSFPLIDTGNVTNFDSAWHNLSLLTSFPAINTSNGLYFGSPTNIRGTWRGCSGLTSFPLLDFSSAISLAGAWYGCTGLTSFPAINTSSVTRFGEGNQGAWQFCSGLTSFPLIDTSNATGMARAWERCSSLTSFPSINTSNCQDFYNTWNNCSSLTSFPALDFSSATGHLGSATSGVGTWRNCSSLTSFPTIDTSGINGNIAGAWAGCTGLTSFPLLDLSNVTSFGEGNQGAWQGCTGLTSFPSIDTSSGIRFQRTWENCNSLTSFPLINTSSGTEFYRAWRSCTSLTSFPLIDTGAGTSFREAWYGCNSLTSFPLINTSSGTDFRYAWYACTSLTSFPPINTAAGTNFERTWMSCNSLTSFPLINISAGTQFVAAWMNCSSLTDFPANFFDSWTGTPANGCFVQAWDGCHALTATSVENILNSIDTSGQSAPASSVDITIRYNTGTGTPSVATAITNLKSRGWTITLNGVAQ